MVTEIQKLPTASTVLITFWGVAGWKMGATPQNQLFKKFLTICQDLRTTLLSISKKFFLNSTLLHIILLSQESDQCAMTSSLRSCQPSLYYKMGNPVKCLFPAAQQVNLPACSPHCPSDAQRQAGKLGIPILSHWFDLTRNQTQVYSFRGGRSYHYHSTIRAVLIPQNSL